MSEMHPEIPADAVLHHQITSMNREFLGLLTHPLLQTQHPVLGLDAGIIGSLRCMSDSQLNRLAAAPLLLAEFAFPGAAEPAPICQVADNDMPAEWFTLLSGYANRLLASLWQLSQRGNGIASFRAGMDKPTAARLAGMHFVELGRYADQLCASLRARHAGHPTCWPDLVRLTIRDADEKLSVAQLGLIPLAVAHQHAQRSD